MDSVQKNILIVEDDDLIAQMYLASLTHSSFHVELQKDGMAGWETMQKYVPDLVILDFMMPKLNGLEVLSKMRTDARLKNVPVVMMSSLMADVDKQRAMEAGATAYWVKKEVNMSDFENRINGVLSK